MNILSMILEMQKGTPLYHEAEGDWFLRKDTGGIVGKVVKVSKRTAKAALYRNLITVKSRVPGMGTRLYEYKLTDTGEAIERG